MESRSVSLRTFGLILAALMALSCGVLLPLLGVMRFVSWPWVVSGLLALTALAAPRALRPIHAVWMRVGAVLGWVNTRLLLGFVFFVVIWPTGVLRRRLGGKMLALERDPALQSYWITRQRAQDPTHFDRPY